MTPNERERDGRGRYIATELADRLERSVVRGATGDCWSWIGAVDEKGYARFAVGKSLRYAHRVSYELHRGTIPDGLTIDHLCRNRFCANPDHLEPVSLRENILRGENPCAINARKTHCPKGHPYEGPNLLVLSGGRRDCRSCRNASHREARARKKASL